MARIQLTKKEAKLRRLLLDVAEYAASTSRCDKPQLRFAGGWVRDKLLGVNSPDIDISVSNMTGLKFAHLMRDFVKDSDKTEGYDKETLSRVSEIPARPEQSKHLETATLKVFGLAIDIVNLRKETYTDDSRNPRMEFGTPEEDALRRDATINALFYNLESEETEDFTGKGLSDMKQKIIRTPLTPFETFKDDPLRVLRCIRFASRLQYSIDADAESSMRDPRIQEALRLKITRERIGVEIEKMLKGPHPESALAYIDRLGLYNVIFTDPSQPNLAAPETKRWWRSYERMFEIAGGSDRPIGLKIKSTLLVEQAEVYIGWLLCALAPWAPLITTHQYSPTRGQPRTFATLVAREGLKVDNKCKDAIEKSMSRLNEAISLKESVLESYEPDIPKKRKREDITRAELGIKLYDWGVSWRSSVLLALLVELMQIDKHGMPKAAGSCVETGPSTDFHMKLAEYTKFLCILEDLGLLDAHQVKPIVNGSRLSEEVGRKPGPWLTEALREMVLWQFSNPHITDTSTAAREALRDIVPKFREGGCQ